MLRLSAEISPVLYRSSIANLNEYYGYSGASQYLGYSLAYFSLDNLKPLYSNLLHDLKPGNRAFLDNGLITAAKHDQFIEPRVVIEQYVSLVSKMNHSQAKHLSIVVPDHPLSPEISLDIVKSNTKALRWLAKRCDLILPVHQSEGRCLVVLNQTDLVSVDNKV